MKNISEVEVPWLFTASAQLQGVGSGMPDAKSRRARLGLAVATASLAAGVGTVQQHLKATGAAESQRLANAYAARCEGRPRPAVRIIGERHSGTTWLGKLLERRLCVRLAAGPYWKHAFFGDRAWELPLSSSSSRGGGWYDPREMVILIARHPHAWLHAMARRPFDGHAGRDDDWAYTKHWVRTQLPGGRAAATRSLDAFLRTPWDGRLPPHVAQGRPEWLPDADAAAGRGEADARKVAAANPVALRTAKLRLAQQLPPAAFAAVCHEDLALAPSTATAALSRLAAALGVEPLPPLAEGDGLVAWFHASSTRSWWSPLQALFSATEARYVPEPPAAATALFTAEQRAFVAAHLDAALEARLNCSSWGVGSEVG